MCVCERESDATRYIKSNLLGEEEGKCNTTNNSLAPLFLHLLIFLFDLAYLVSLMVFVSLLHIQIEKKASLSILVSILKS